MNLTLNFNLLLISKLCKEFAANNAKINQTEEILIKIAEETLKSKIEALPELAQLDKATRDLVINELMNTPEVKSAMKGLVRDITNNIHADHSIIQMINTALKKEHELAHNLAAKEVYVAAQAACKDEVKKCEKISASNLEQFTPAALTELDAAATSCLSAASGNPFDFSSMSFESIERNKPNRTN